MSPNSIHDQLLNAIRERFPSKQIVGYLMDILYLGKEAVYRRLRGEVSFTLEEASTIAIELGISLDNIMGNENPKSRPFQLKLTGFVNPTAEDYHQMSEFIGFLQTVVKIPNTEIGGYGNSFEFSLTNAYDHITKFFYFKWFYQRKGKGGVKFYKDIVVSEEHRWLGQQHVILSKEIKKTYYIWDYMIFQYIINDINYFKEIRSLAADDVILLKEELHSFVDYLEKIAVDGCFETGNPVEFYISNINFDSTYSYMQCDYINLSLIRAFTLNSLASTNYRTTEDVKNWVLSQKRHATLISESGEKERIAFFKKQREIIDTIC